MSHAYARLNHFSKATILVAGENFGCGSSRCIRLNDKILRTTIFKNVHNCNHVIAVEYARYLTQGACTVGAIGFWIQVHNF